jgi:hypothetical protein
VTEAADVLKRPTRASALFLCGYASISKYGILDPPADNGGRIKLMLSVLTVFRFGDERTSTGQP